MAMRHDLAIIDPPRTMPPPVRTKQKSWSSNAKAQQTRRMKISRRKNFKLDTSNIDARYNSQCCKPAQIKTVGKQDEKLADPPKIPGNN